MRSESLVKSVQDRVILYTQKRLYSSENIESMRRHRAARTKGKGGDDKWKRCVTVIEWWWNEHARAVLRCVAGGREGAFPCAAVQLILHWLDPAWLHRN